MAAYYNEFDPFAAEWLRELIKDGLIADGEVDNRDMREVDVNDIRGFTQHHFFAGIGGWSYALRLAGWGDNRPVITGSPPCQPFSHAGKRKGQADERHLWPAFFNLIRELKPPTVFGEQVASAIRTGWFDDLQADMEGEGYACGMVVLPAASVGAPHKRDRLWFVANANNQRPQGRHSSELPECSGQQSPGSCCSSGPLADSATQRPHHQKDQQELEREGCGEFLSEQSRACTVGNSNINGCSERGEATTTTGHGSADDAASWADTQLIYCRDGKYRPISTEPSLFPLANGLPNRVGILRGAGNAIVPQVAAEVIRAFMRYLK